MQSTNYWKSYIILKIDRLNNNIEFTLYNYNTNSNIDGKEFQSFQCKYNIRFHSLLSNYIENKLLSEEIINYCSRTFKCKLSAIDYKNKQSHKSID